MTDVTLGFDWIDGALVPRPGTCPHPLSSDWSEEGCVARGECGCKARLRLDAPKDQP
jgi:hypothetical protein